MGDTHTTNTLVKMVQQWIYVYMSNMKMIHNFKNFFLNRVIIKAEPTQIPNSIANQNLIRII